MCIVILNYVKVYAYKYIHIYLYVYVYMCMYSIGICICDKSPVGIGLSMAFRHDLMHNCWWNSHVCWLHYDGSRLNHVKSCEIYVGFPYQPHTLGVWIPKALAFVLALSFSFSFACWRSGKTGHGSNLFRSFLHRTTPKVCCITGSYLICRI